MQLRDRKRINNIPRFNGGIGDRSAMIDQQNAFTQNAMSTLDSKAYMSTDLSSLTSGQTSSSLGMTNAGAQLASKPSMNQINNMNLPASGGVSSAISQNISSNAISIGNALSQQNKFTNSTSNDVRNIGGTVAKTIPGKWGTAAQTAVDLAADTIGMANYKHTNDEMFDEAGTSQSQINGVSYTTQNTANTAAAYSDVKSTAIKNAVAGGFKGSGAGWAVGGPLGAILGGILGNTLGIFSGRKAMIRQKRINRNTAKQQEMINQQQFAYADSEGLRNRYYSNHRDTTGDILSANRGKDRNVVLRKRNKNSKV